jgi:hypothetical protein
MGRPRCTTNNLDNMSIGVQGTRWTDKAPRCTSVAKIDMDDAACQPYGRPRVPEIPFYLECICIFYLENKF